MKKNSLGAQMDGCSLGTTKYLRTVSEEGRDKGMGNTGHSSQGAGTFLGARGVRETGGVIRNEADTCLFCEGGYIAKFRLSRFPREN